MKLVITIDTEEDTWGQYHRGKCSFENIQKIDVLQGLFDRYEARPTYLVTYPVATDNASVRRLRPILEDGKCEIGTHCHPWNTPPFKETSNAHNSMLCNLETSLQCRKVMAVHNSIARSFGIQPTSFRAGRWGFGEHLPPILRQLGYQVDSSIIAFQDWSDFGGPDNSYVSPTPFKWSHTDKWPTLLLEVPATAGFTQRNFTFWNDLWQAMGNKYLQKLHPRGLLSMLG